MGSEDQKKPKPKKNTSLSEVALKVLRQDLHEAQSDLRAARKALAGVENGAAAQERRLVAAELDAEALLNAVRALAVAVPSTTAAGRRVRAEARQYLEARRIKPPSSLGASRRPPKKRAKKKKRS